MIDKLRDSSYVAAVLGGVFIAIAILGFIPNPIVGANGFFVTNVAHNFVHLLGGVFLILAAKKHLAKKALLIVGIVYMLVAILGYVTMGHMLLGVVAVNMADHYLHLVLALVIIGAGLYAKK